MEGVKHVHRFRETGCVDDPVCTRFLPNANFFDAPANRRHWLEVIWRFSVLHSLQLPTCVAAGLVRKIAQLLQRIAEKPNRLQ